MIGKALLFVFAIGLVSAIGHARDGGLQRAIDLLRSGDARAALAAADAETDARERARARVYVLHQVGDLEGALVAARAGSDAYPDDAWLAERFAWIASTLRRARTAELAAERLARAALIQPGPERARWQDAARVARENAAALVLAHARRDSAERSARIVAFAVLGGSLVVLAALVAMPRRQRMSSTPADVTGSKSVDGGNQ